MGIKKKDPQALATELFARLDAARESLGGTLPRATAIATAAKLIEEECMPKKKANSFADMTDQDFKEYLLNTYLWLDADRELAKCAAWTKINIQGSSGPTRRRIINWMNKAKADKPYDARAASGIPGSQMPPVPEPESWREIIIRCASENSVWRSYVDENKQWLDLGRKAQLSIADFVECNRR